MSVQPGERLWYKESRSGLKSGAPAGTIHTGGVKLLFMILQDGSLYQEHMPSRNSAQFAVDLMRPRWAEWMGERLDIEVVS